MGKPPKVIMPPALQKLFPQKRWKVPVPTREILPLQEKLGLLLKRAWPDGSEKDVSSLTVSFAALWEVSRVHIILVRKLVKMADAPDKRQLQQISQELDVNWFSNASYWTQELRRTLARFKGSLYKNERFSKADSGIIDRINKAAAGRSPKVKTRKKTRKLA